MIVVENAEAWEDDDKPPQPAPGEKLKIPGSIVSIVERLDDELTRSLQHIDPHTAEYIERLSDEQALYNKIVRAMLYVEELQKDPKLEIPQENVNRIVMRRVEHIYFKVRLKFKKVEYFAYMHVSRLRLSISWKKTHGSLCLHSLTPRSHREVKLRTLPH